MAAPANYIDVAERIEQFYAKYEDGRLTSDVNPYVVTVGDSAYIVYIAKAYRTPDDPHPGVGAAWEPVPGKTNFTRDSELMNAETSAWGRAIVAVGFASKGNPIASANEVRNRTGESKPAKARRSPAKAKEASQGDFLLPANDKPLKGA